MTSAPLIEIEGLRVVFHGDGGRITHAVDQVATRGAPAQAPESSFATRDPAQPVGAVELLELEHKLLQIGEQLLSMIPPGSDPWVMYNTACSWARAGDVERSIGWLKNAVDFGWSDLQTLSSDHALAFVKAGFNLIPFVGGSLASLVGDYVPFSTQRTMPPKRSTSFIVATMAASILSVSAST